MPRGRAALLGLLLVAAACAPVAPPVARTLTTPPACSGGGVSVHADFEGAGLASCTIEDSGLIRAHIEPEVMPINPSPWYAFRIEGPAGVAPQIQLRYSGAAHRYAPWTKGPGDGWRAVPAGQVQVAADGSAMVSLPPIAGATLVAAQPLDDPKAALAPWQNLARAGRMEAIEAGPTVDGRSLLLFLHRPAGAKGLLVLTTRQHPPEVPGAVAFDAFVARLFSDATHATALRAQIAILLVPVMNPDGIARGHWRGNAAGADLNRDWGIFSQPETRAAGKRIEQLAAALPLLALIDFHATRRDVIYAPPLDAARRDSGEEFVARFGATSEGGEVAVSRSHTPGSGTLKGWALDRFGVSGLTYEVADAADPAATRARAVAAADSLIAALLHQIGDGQGATQADGKRQR